MSSTVATLPAAPPAQAVSEIMERVLIAGDLSQLTPEERTSYYMQVCRSTGLNPLTRPFEYARLSGKTVLYARKDAADQLRRIHGVSLEITDRKVSGDIITVAVRASLPDGRHDEDIGALSSAGLKGEALANAMMKTITKAKRRATLSLCGLGLLDESEVEAVQAMEQAGDRGSSSSRPAIEHQPAPPPPAIGKGRIAVKAASGSGFTSFARSREGIAEALTFIAAGGAPLVMSNHDLLANVAKMDVFASQVEAIRRAAMAELEGESAGEAWPGQAAGAEPPEPPGPPDQEQDSTAERHALLRGDRPADMSEAEASGLPG